MIELLAVIVILAIIMVIAVPQIMNVIDSSKESAWDDNVKLLKEAVIIDAASSGSNSIVSSTYCNSSNFEDKLKQIADVDTNSIAISNINWNPTTSTCTFTLEPKGKFKGSNVTYSCNNTNCE